MRPGSDIARIAPLLGQTHAYSLDVFSPEAVFSEHPIDLVIHCATNYGRSGERPSEILDANLILPLRLLQLASEQGARAFINSDTILDKRISNYSLSKRQFAEWLSLYGTRLVCANVALEHFYGPGDDPSKFVTHLVQSLLRAVPRIALTPGLQKRDFIYIDDVVEAFVRLAAFSLETAPGFYRFEVGTNESISIRDFAEQVHRLAGEPATILDLGALPYRENEVMESTVDTTMLRHLGWVPKVALREGLEQTIEAERKRLHGR
jgi:nucleoside-diphosphate-sugar epimerase